jgi:predicted transcriptional regulator
MNEPRIHLLLRFFFLSKFIEWSLYQANLEKQLTVAKSFINDKSKNTITARVKKYQNIRLVSGDFKNKGTVIDFLNQYSSIKINSKAKLGYKEYNWTLNE